MSHYVEVLVEQNVEKERTKRKILIMLLLILMLAAGIFTAIPLFFLLALVCVGAFFRIGVNYQLEYEYYFLDGDLTISKVINQARRKTVMELNGGSIKLVAPAESDEVAEYGRIKCMDYSAKDANQPVYALVCEYKGSLKKVLLQMNDELYKEMKRKMPYKVKRS